MPRLDAGIRAFSRSVRRSRRGRADAALADRLDRADARLQALLDRLEDGQSRLEESLAVLGRVSGGRDADASGPPSRRSAGQWQDALGRLLGDR